MMLNSFDSTNSEQTKMFHGKQNSFVSFSFFLSLLYIAYEEKEINILQYINGIFTDFTISICVPIYFMHKNPGKNVDSVPVCGYLKNKNIIICLLSDSQNCMLSKSNTLKHPRLTCNARIFALPKLAISLYELIWKFNR